MLFGVAAIATAQSLTARNSTLNYSYVYGFANDVQSGGNTVTDNALLGSDSEADGFSGMTSGNYLGLFPYSGSVTGTHSHTYSVNGPLSAFSSISASGSTSATSSISGSGGADMTLKNPGNLLDMRFTLTGLKQYALVGSLGITPSEASAFSYVALQKFDGIVWQNVQNSIFLPGNQGSFNYAGTLTAGDYRVTSALSMRAFGNASVSGSYQYNLTLVPEPVSIIGVSVACGWLLKRRKVS